MLTLFAGRPAAGKSTAARWFAAQWSRGGFDGTWHGQPQKIAYIAGEEPLRFIVKPSLIVAGADRRRVFYPEVQCNGQQVPLLADIDETALTEYLVSNGVKVIVVDPIMATIHRKTDIYRNNELRDAIAPWVRIAEKVNGVVLGIVHLTKGTTGDIVASINGSSGFGEVARCVFGFAVDPQDEDERVMTQAKNSCGRNGLSLAYAIESVPFTADSGKTAEIARFGITGESERTVSEMLVAAANPGRGLSPKQKRIVDFVNQREATTAAELVTAGICARLNTAQQTLKRLFNAGHIDRPTHGFYTPKTDK